MKQVEILWHTPGHSEPCPGCSPQKVHKRVVSKTQGTRNMCGSEFDAALSMRAWRAVNCPECTTKRAEAKYRMGRPYAQQNNVSRE